ncbi:NAD-dependent histone deacetylase sir2 [Myotisia sp. PD_48]|nr:NAD-dependent histone deacetylase sir2 [Myotisia sp. PD_48]
MDVAKPPAGDEGVRNEVPRLVGEPVVGASAPSPRVDLDENALHPLDGEDGDDSDEEWETTSLYEDSLQFIGDERLRDGVPNACTLQEAIMYRKRLRAIGQVAFAQETIGQGTITAKKLCTAFGIIPPPFLDGAPDKAYHPLLIMAMSRESSKRFKLPEYNTVDDVVGLIKRSKNIVVLTGAGISTSLGIPDFRSKDIGLYSKIAHLGLSDPQEVFDIDVFREDPSIFFSVAKDILPTVRRFSPTHAFIRLLQDKGKLLTNFTQNIDNLEEHAGILPEKLIQCHGSFATATCLDCKHQVPGPQLFSAIRRNEIPKCSRCIEELQPQGLKRKRGANGPQRIDGRFHPTSDDDAEYDEYSAPTRGVMKPDITFFGEDLPDSFKRRLLGHDREKADLVIVIGTSLKVAPVAEIPGVLPSGVPQVYISRTPVSHIGFDVDMIGDCDVVVAELCRRAGWVLTHEMIPKNQRVEVKLEEGFESRYTFTAINI